KDPKSLWSAFYPRSPMLWDWSEESDGRVEKLWHLRTELSECRDVVYAKWFKGRATVFSRPVFVAMMAALETTTGLQKPYSREAATIMAELNENSPQSTKMLRGSTELQGKLYESALN